MRNLFGMLNQPALKSKICHLAVKGVRCCQVLSGAVRQNMHPVYEAFRADFIHDDYFAVPILL